ncbi:MAG: hypothetical protein KKF41_15715 [Actinobacteria bacterium]|nr:hypothetical protein [Actinomycetota bacterium]MBU1943814.1 hypothetical protein [Actinomycetota bacterium]MBU2689025.1 hypothetical protein [Actinomycetota bacterium]
MEDVKLANPAVLGLTCFGIATTLLNIHNVGIIKMDPTILGLGTQAELVNEMYGKTILPIWPQGDRVQEPRGPVDNQPL